MLVSVSSADTTMPQTQPAKRAKIKKIVVNLIFFTASASFFCEKFWFEYIILQVVLTMVFLW